MNAALSQNLRTCCKMFILFFFPQYLQSCRFFWVCYKCVCICSLVKFNKKYLWGKKESELSTFVLFFMWHLKLLIMGFKEALTLSSYQCHTVFLFALVVFGLDNLSLREKDLFFLLGEGKGCCFEACLNIIPSKGL